MNNTERALRDLTQAIRSLQADLAEPGNITHVLRCLNEDNPNCWLNSALSVADTAIAKATGKDTDR